MTKNRIASITTALVFVVYLIYPIPHTIALRNILLALLLLCAVGGIVVFRSSIPQRDWMPFRAPGALLGTLTLWLIVQSAYISPVSEQALGMFRGDWLIALAAALIGACSVPAADRSLSGRILPALAFSLLLHVAFLLIYQTGLWLNTGHFPLGTTPFAQRDYHSTLVTALAALALSDLLARAIIHRRLVDLPLLWPASTAVLCSIASLTLQARNATIIIAILIATAGVTYITLAPAPPRRKLTLIAFLALLLGAGGWIGLHSDTRWATFQDSISIAFDTENHLAWLDPQRYPWPVTKAGDPVEESAYLRIAWAKVGVEQIAEYPLGLGYGHKAFGWAVSRSYHVKTGIESSHSGLIDFTLANGIPGLLLWLALSASLITAGLRTFQRKSSATGIALSLTVVAYLVRCLIDGHLSGFRLEMYAFLVGVLVMKQVLDDRKCG